MKNADTKLEAVYLKKLADRIKTLRLEKGFTNRDFLAYDSRLSRTLVKNYEDGKNVTFRNLVKLIKNGLKMDIEEFFGSGFDKEAPVINKEIKTTRKTKKKLS